MGPVAGSGEGQSFPLETHKGFYYLPQVPSMTPGAIAISARKDENVVACEVIKARPGSGLHGFLSPES